MNPLRIFAAPALLATLLLLSACATRTPAPVIERPRAEMVTPPGSPAPVSSADKRPDAPPQTHVVAKGETLIAIALQYGLDYKELAAWNQIENVNVIQVGQELKVTPPPAPAVVATPLAMPGSPVATPITATPPIIGTPSPAGPPSVPPGPDGKAAAATLKTEPKAVKVPYSDKALAELEAEARTQGALEYNPPAAVAASGTPPAPVPPKADDDKLEWAWPAKGKLLAGYSESSKGIDIGGTRGTPVLAAGNGKVMYSGTGIRGYGKLVIIKHNNMYLSAYAHNDNVLVKEGQEVRKGQKIAEMGATDADQVKLHFEIRRQGKPVDPAKLLPAS